MDKTNFTKSDIGGVLGDAAQVNVCKNSELSRTCLVSHDSLLASNNDLSQREFIWSMKGKVLDIRKHLEGLKGTVKDVTSAKFNAGISKNDDIREQNIEIITNYIAFIRTQFKSLKIEGQKSFECLQMFENELQRDIIELKNVMTQESLSNTSEKEYTKDVYKNHSDDSKVEQNLTKNNSLSFSSEPCSVPLFHHDWDERDHVVFVRIFNKYSKHSKILEECQNILPYRSEEDLNIHIKNYTNFLEKRDHAREMIRIWKEKKDIEKQDKIKKLEDERKKLEEEEEKKKDKLRVKNNHEKALQYQKLKEWKNTKNEDKDFRNVKEVDSHSSPCNNMPERNKAVCHSYSDKEREEIAYRLQVYREEKLRKEIEEKSNSQRKNLNSNKEKLLQLWKRDQEYILAKRQQKELKDKITEDKQVQMSKLRLKVNSRVPSIRSRVLQTTASHEAFKRSKQKSSQCFSIDHTEKRAVPSWRQDL
ncbi:unnamed protein product [Meganyctiphanes norvegica]|uniref:Coiled-coil domain-containing protein 112 n=1 Tax=Meganyctiphanes norvegica TaxID=48144 RepID=A0AAV2QLK6_MEGNR